MPLKNIVTIAVAVLVSLACYSAVTKSRHANLYAEAVDIINREALNEHDDEELFARSVGGLLSEDDDPYFSFLRNRGYEQLIEMLYQEFAGVGVYYDFDFEREEVFVLAPVPNGPADEAGLLPGDIFRKIDGQAVRFDRESSGVESLRGPEGTSVVVTIERDGNLRDFSVNRKKIQIQTVHGDWMSADGVWEFVLKDSPEIGYLNILDFGYETTEEVGDALDQISEKIDGLIIDLRRNGGGPLDAAVNVCDMFLPEGRLIVETRGRGGVIREQRFSTAKQRLSDEIPIAILTDRNTASASEIVAACLQDHHRAVIIGERTFGKGTVQDVVTLQPKRSALKLTTASYWRPSNRNIDRRTSEQAAKRDPTQANVWGVIPDPGMNIEMSERELIANYRRRFLRDFQGIHEARGFVPNSNLRSYFESLSSDSEEGLAGVQEEPSEQKNDAWGDPLVTQTTDESKTGSIENDEKKQETPQEESFVQDRVLQKAVEVLKSRKRREG